MPVLGTPSLYRLARVFGVTLGLALGLAACSNVPPSNVKSNARLTPTTGISRDLTRLPKPMARIPVAVYGFRDQTGQFKTSPDSAYSTLVTQGAASILVKALEDSGWYIPLEREGLQNLLTERRIVRAIESPTDKGKPVINLPNMLPASMVIEGGVIAYETNVRTGGKGASYLGIGASTQYRVDQVTVGLRDVDVRNGQVLNTVSVTKTIYSTQFSANLYKFTSYQHLLQAETGYTTNEPAQLAVREAIEAAVIHLTAVGIRDRYFELQDASQWDNPVIQAYLAEALANLGEEPAGEEGLIPMRPLGADCESVVRPLSADDKPGTACAGGAGANAAIKPKELVKPRPVVAAALAATPASAPAVPTAAARTAEPARAAAKPAPPASPVTVPVPAPAGRLVSAPAAPTPVPPVPPVPVPPTSPSAVKAAVPAAVPPALPVPSPAPAAADNPSKPKAGSAEDIFNQYWKSR